MKRMLLALAVLAVAGAAQAQDPIEIARSQYDRAEFEEALATLTRLGEGTAPAARRYQALCMMALGRDQDAERVVAAMLTADPLLPSSLDQQPPRFRALVGRVRDRLLPTLVEQHYTAGRIDFDRGAWRGAAQQFGLVLALTDAPQVAAGPLGETRRLSADFLALAAARHAAMGNAGTVLSAVSAEAPAGTTAPVPVWQDAPLLPFGGAAGVITVLIGKRGAVESAKLVRSVNWVYDPILLMAARMWRYKPAERDGLPVQYLLTLRVDAAGTR